MDKKEKPYIKEVLLILRHLTCARLFSYKIAEAAGVGTHIDKAFT